MVNAVCILKKISEGGGRGGEKKKKKKDAMSACRL